MEKQVVATAKAPGAIGPYSQGIKVGNLVFVSGCLPIDMATGQLSTGDIAEQTRHSLRNVTAILEAAGSSLDKVVKTTIFVKDLKNFQTINAAYAEFFATDEASRPFGELEVPEFAGVVWGQPERGKWTQPHSPPRPQRSRHQRNDACECREFPNEAGDPATDAALGFLAHVGEAGFGFR